MKRMKSSAWRCAFFLLLAGATSAWAQAPAPAAVASAPAKASPPDSQKHVLEDDQVRIEESRARGQLQRVTVRNKQSGTSYEIIVSPAGRDPSQGRGASGQRAWSLFDF
jgi:hypothetical protein